MTHEALDLQLADRVATLWMNRPERHNAFDAALIAALTEAVERLARDDAVRVIVLAGRGLSFSAGADLDWMRRQAEAGFEANLEDARRLASLFRTLYRCPKPTVARVHGAALGGGMGLIAASDIAIASSAATFGTTEVRVGLVPATVGPYLVPALGARAARRYFQTGERFGAAEALRLGLVHEVSRPEALDERVTATVRALLASGPAAQAQAKKLIRDTLGFAPDDDPVLEGTARAIATVRASAEGREGLAAFLEKRKPAWAHR